MTASTHFITEQEYLDGEQHSEVRHEYIDGQVFAMIGASRRHGLIVNALAFALTPGARRQGCQLFTSGMKLRLEIGGHTIFTTRICCWPAIHGTTTRTSAAPLA